MTRTARSAAAAAVGAVVLTMAFGGPGPVAAAVPAGHVEHAQGGHGGHGGKGGHGPSSDQALRPVLRQIARVDARLARTLRENRASALEAGALAALQTNVDADRQALADLVASLEAGDTTVGDSRSVLRTLHPENYTQAVNFLRKGARLSASIDDATAAVGADPAASADLAAALDAASAAVASAMERAALLTASSSRADLRAVQGELVAAVKALGPVLDYLGGADDSADDSVDPTDPADPAVP